MNPLSPVAIVNAIAPIPGLEAAELRGKFRFSTLEFAADFVADLIAKGALVLGDGLTPATDAEMIAGIVTETRAMTPAQIALAIEALALAPDLSAYVTSTGLTAALGSYVTSAALTTQLGSYALASSTYTKTATDTLLNARLLKVNNLSDVQNPAAALSNLGAGTAAARDLNTNPNSVADDTFATVPTSDDYRLRRRTMSAEALLVHAVDGIADIPAQAPKIEYEIDLDTLFNFSENDLLTITYTGGNMVVFEFDPNGDGANIGAYPTLAGAALADKFALGNAIKDWFDSNRPGLFTIDTNLNCLNFYGQSNGESETLSFEAPYCGIFLYKHGEDFVGGVTDEPGVSQVILYTPNSFEGIVFFDQASIRSVGTSTGPDQVEIGYIDNQGNAGSPGEFYPLYGTYLGTISGTGGALVNSIVNAGDYFPPDNTNMIHFTKGIMGASLVARVTGNARFYGDDIIAAVRFSVGG